MSFSMRPFAQPHQSLLRREKFGISAEKKDGANHQKCSVSFKALLLQLLFASDSALKDGAWKGHLHGGDQLSTREAPAQFWREHSCSCSA